MKVYMKQVPTYVQSSRNLKVSVHMRQTCNTVFHLGPLVRCSQVTSLHVFSSKPVQAIHVVNETSGLI